MLEPMLTEDRGQGRRRPVRDLHRAGRRRPLRQDGPQRHRVRRHAADRRGLRHAEARARPDRAGSSPTSSPSGTRASWTRYLIEITAKVLAFIDEDDRQAAGRRDPRHRPSRRAPGAGRARTRSSWRRRSRRSTRRSGRAQHLVDEGAARRGVQGPAGPDGSAGTAPADAKAADRRRAKTRSTPPRSRATRRAWRCCGRPRERYGWDLQPRRDGAHLEGRLHHPRRSCSTRSSAPSSATRT